MTPALMIQGTGSSVGKSLLVAGLCRAARARGLAVAPFKPQNMSNNAAVAADGGEIGRAEIATPIPTAARPPTRLHPQQHARALAAPPGIDLPPAFAIGAIFQPE